MATLTKFQPAELDDNRLALSSSIPAPFSSAERDFILQSPVSNGLPRSITPSPIAHQHPRLAQETQVFGEVLLNVDRASPTVAQVNSLPNLRPCLIWHFQSRIKMSFRQ